jgi:hypothetical protein
MVRAVNPRLLCLIVLAGLLLAAAGGHAQTAGRAPAAGTPSPGDVTMIDAQYPVSGSGELRMWQAYSSQGCRVMLKVYRAEGSRLVLVGASPLVTLAPGALTTFECRIPVSRNDMVGCYCPDSTCVDSFADGVVLTAPGDVGTSATGSFTSAVGSPAVYAAGSPLFDAPSSAATDLVLPVAARTPGFEETLWTTSLEVFNTGSATTTVTLYFNRSGEDNTNPWASGQLVVPARGVVVVDDLLDTLFAVEHGTGSVDLLATAPILAHARIANIGGADGTYGQYVPAIPAKWAIGDDDAPGLNPNADIVYVFEAREDDTWRTNLGVVNLSAVATTVTARAFVGTSALGQAANISLPPFSHRQVDRILDHLQVPRGTSGVRVDLSVAAAASGRFLAYGSRIDNRTGDAVFLPGVRENTIP